MPPVLRAAVWERVGGHICTLEECDNAYKGLRDTSPEHRVNKLMQHVALEEMMGRHKFKEEIEGTVEIDMLSRPHQSLKKSFEGHIRDQFLRVKWQYMGCKPMKYPGDTKSEGITRFARGLGTRPNSKALQILLHNMMGNGMGATYDPVVARRMAESLLHTATSQFLVKGTVLSDEGGSSTSFSPPHRRTEERRVEWTTDWMKFEALNRSNWAEEKSWSHDAWLKAVCRPGANHLVFPFRAVNAVHAAADANKLLYKFGVVYIRFVVLANYHFAQEDGKEAEYDYVNDVRMEFGNCAVMHSMRLMLFDEDDEEGMTQDQMLRQIQNLVSSFTAQPGKTEWQNRNWADTSYFGLKVGMLQKD